MLDAIDAAPAGSVYVMVLENGLDYAGMGALMATAMKARGLTAAVIDGGVRDTPQIGRIQFPVCSRGIVPSTTINHFRFAGANVPVTCAGVRVNPGDIIVADEDGVAVVPKAHAAEVLKKAEEMTTPNTPCCPSSRSSNPSRKPSPNSAGSEWNSRSDGPHLQHRVGVRREGVAEAARLGGDGALHRLHRCLIEIVSPI